MTKWHGKGHIWEWNHYQYSFKKNLILIGQAINKEFIVTHEKNMCFLIVDKGQGKVVMTKIGSNKLYKLQIEMIFQRFS